VSTAASGLNHWWRERGYFSNPFAWSNAAEVGERIFPDFFQSWYVEPDMPTGLPRAGETPTLDRAKSLETSMLILIYAPAGGGKTFYRRWAAWQIKERAQYALEIRNLREEIGNPENVIARDLAFCVYKRVCEKFFIGADLPRDGHVEHIFKQCDEVIRHCLPDSQSPKRMYVFINDIDQLFDERLSRAEQNAQVLTAIVDFCRIAAARGGGEPLALRMFIPAQLRKPIQRRLGTRQRRRIREYNILWGADHCLDIVERRLVSCWGNIDSRGDHVNCLLTHDTLNAFRKWLQRQGSISPRCVIDVLDRLGHYAYSCGVTTDELIDLQLWRKFLKSPELVGSCDPDRRYPLCRWPFLVWKPRRWLWPFPFLLVFLLGVIWYLGSSAHGDAESVFFFSVSLVRGMIAWLAAASDWIEGFILLTAAVGAIVFVFWCLRESKQSGQQLDLRECLWKVWQLIYKYLSGGPK